MESIEQQEYFLIFAPLINPFNPLLVKKIVKPLFLGLCLLALSTVTFSQNKLPIANDFAADLRRVIREYPHHFTKLQGEIIDEKPQSVDYACTFKLNGEESSAITRYSANNKEVYSWQALMLTTDDFEEAKKKYRTLFTRLNHLPVKMDYGVTFYLKGKYAEPVEEKNFSSSVLTFELADRITSKMRLEVSMQYELMEWKVRLLIYEREREDTESGDLMED